ncbi:dihydrofolate reductase family protein [Asanoa sp. WMMD1127]|uniref:dihydrofolate reductase family protein n=1 Tax=Asanoa sp. WMMD1127 TaxID=3016107 RepID=UPI0024177B59|nr:dihydrofolate reductase family protein [Asanoa sp. WMMD1127]MDG4822858.1 dihydrofolate reductase family protein [Asanoa sp. WMMD1127]
MKVSTGASMSIDGYVSGPGETGFEHLFAWYGNGDVEMPTGNPEMTFRMTQQSYDHQKAWTGEMGALVVGRKLFDMTNAWGGMHPLQVPTVVLTHNPPAGFEDNKWFAFETGGIEAAITKAYELGGGKTVGLNSGTIASQALDAGLVDEVWVDLVPVILGGGTPFFSQLGNIPVELEGPLEAVQGNRVTHLRFKVKK